MIDLEKLEALAKAATPGPWQGDRIDGTVRYDIISMPFTENFKVVMHGDNGNASDGGYGFTSEEDENYVLAANPAAILALIAEVRALREDAARYQWLRSKARMTDYDGGNYGVWDIRGIDAYSNWIKAPYNHKTFEGAVDFARGAK